MVSGRSIRSYRFTLNGSSRTFEFHVKSRERNVPDRERASDRATGRQAEREGARVENESESERQKQNEPVRVREREKAANVGGRREDRERRCREGRRPLVTMVRVGPTTLRQPSPLVLSTIPNTTLPLVPGFALHLVVLPRLPISLFVAPSLSRFLFLSFSLSLPLGTRCKPTPSINITLFERTTARLSANRALSY